MLTENCSAAFALACKRLGLSAKDPVSIAVSGGPDSLLLAALSAEYFDDAEALIVDHRMRDGSAKEAQAVCHQLGNRLALKARILRDETVIPVVPTSQASARALRYRLLFKNAKNTLLVGHNWNDQRETFLMRLVHQSRLTGLAGMSMRLSLGDTVIGRPLLGLDRQAIEKAIEERGLEPVRDPSNDDPKYERIRIREQLRQMDGAADHWDSLITKFGALRRSIDKQAQAFLATIQTAGDLAQLPYREFQTLDRLVQERILTALSGWFWDAQEQFLEKPPQLSFRENRWHGGRLRFHVSGNRLWVGPDIRETNAHTRTVVERRYGIDDSKWRADDGPLVWRFPTKQEAQQFAALGAQIPTPMLLSLPLVESRGACMLPSIRFSDASPMGKKLAQHISVTLRHPLPQIDPFTVVSPLVSPMGMHRLSSVTS